MGPEPAVVCRRSRMEIGQPPAVASPAATPALPVAAPNAHGAGGADLAKLALGAIGVVYGDIGTSPLYAIRECVTLPHGVAPVGANIFGVLSLVFWSITLVVSVKYLLYVMRAHNDGEGGVLALMALVARPAPTVDRSVDESGAVATSGSSMTTWTGVRRTKMVMILLGLFGAALLYGDGVITPAISVLSAVEGLEVATSAFSNYVVPITCLILVGLFAVQKRGTGGIGTIFGPVTVLWFISIAAVGLPW